MSRLPARAEGARAGLADRVEDPERLGALRATGLLDSEVEDAFDRLTRLAGRLLGVPVALVSLVDADRQFFKSSIGLPEPWASARETPLSHSFCQHVVGSGEPLLVADAREHPELRDNLAVPDLGVVAYAGVPLATEGGQVLGSFCAIDGRPRQWTAEDVATLRDLAGAAMTEIALRLRVRQAETLAESLRESEELFRTTVDNAPIGTAIVTPDGHWLRVNRALCEITGYTEAELLAGRWQEITAPEDLAQDQAQARRLFGGEIARYELEKCYLRRDGTGVPVLLTASLVRDAAGAPLYGIAQVQDISARKRTEAALAASERRLAYALDGTNDGLWDWDLRSGDAYFSPRWHTMLGYAPDEVEPSVHTWERLMHPDDAARVTAALAEHFDNRSPFYGTEFRLRHRNGSWVWILARGRVVERDEAGRPLRAVGTHSDITDRKEVEEALWRSQADAREEEARFRDLLESTSEGIYGIDVEGRCTFVNRAALEMLGFTADELLGRELHGLIHHTRPDGTPYPVEECRIAQAARTGRPTRLDDEVLWRRDGTSFPAEYASAPLARDGQVHGAVVTFVDITERKRDQAERERLLDQAQEARARAEAALRARDEVLGVVAHDLRNPVGTIITSAAFLVDVPLPEAERNRQIGVILRAGRRADRLIQDLLDIARIEAGALKVSAEPVRVGPLLAEVREWAEPQVTAAGLHPLLEAAPEVGEACVLADRDRVVQVFTNLVGNAVKFTPRDGRVAVRAELRSGAVRFSVSDTGMGMPAEQLPHLFTRFWQANQADRRGAGLGLAIVQGIVDAHGGRLGAESTPGQGTTVWFELPLAPGDDADADG